MAAKGLLCRQYLGWKQIAPRLLQAIDYLVRNSIRFADMDFYYWYYGTHIIPTIDQQGHRFTKRRIGPSLVRGCETTTSPQVFVKITLYAIILQFEEP